MPTAASKTASAKAKAAEAQVTEVQTEVDNSQASLEKDLLELQTKFTQLQADNQALAKAYADKEIGQRLWIKEAKDAELFRVGTTKDGKKKLTFSAAKSTKNAQGQYEGGAWKTLVVTDNGHGPNATKMQAALEEGHRMFNFEMFEKTFKGRDGRGNSYYYVTQLEPHGTPAQTKQQEAPALDELDEII